MKEPRISPRTKKVQVWKKSPRTRISGLDEVFKKQPFKGPQAEHIRNRSPSEEMSTKGLHLQVGHVSHGCLIGSSFAMIDSPINQFLKDAEIFDSWPSLAKASTEPRRGPQRSN